MPTPLTGIWRGDPSPLQRQPSAPIPAQGQQPPRVATQFATAMAIVAMSWPSPGDPRPIQPRQVTLPTAPIPAQGQMPPLVGPLQIEDVVITRSAWSEPGEPRPYPTRATAVSFAPIPAQGQQPPLTAVQQAALASVVATWQPTWSGAPPGARVAPFAIVIIPAAQPFASSAGAPVAQWPPPWTAPPPLVDVAPLTLVYGQQPPSIAAAVPQATLVSWLVSWQQPPQPTETVPPPVLAAAQPFTSPSTAPLSAWSSAPSQAPRPTLIAPLTLTYGAQPPSVGVATPQQLATIAGMSPPVWWNASAAAPVAAWAGSIIVPPAQPAPPPQFGIASWPPLWYGPPAPVRVAPLTLVYGAAPPVTGAITPQNGALIGAQSPPAWWPASSAAPVAAFAGSVIVPPAQPCAPPQFGISAWPDAWYGPPEPVEIAPLTLVYGQSPSIGSARAAQERASTVGMQWPAVWTAPQTLVQVSTLTILPPPVPPATVTTAIGAAVLQTWRPPWIQPQRLITTAPLTLAYGQAPPVRALVSPAQLAVVLPQWPAAWWPQQARGPLAAWAPSLVIPPMYPPGRFTLAPNVAARFAPNGSISAAFKAGSITATMTIGANVGATYTSTDIAARFTPTLSS